MKGSTCKHTTSDDFDRRSTRQRKTEYKNSIPIKSIKQIEEDEKLRKRQLAILHEKADQQRKHDLLVALEDDLKLEKFSISYASPSAQRQFKLKQDLVELAKKNKTEMFQIGKQYVTVYKADTIQETKCKKRGQKKTRAEYESAFSDFIEEGKHHNVNNQMKESKENIERLAFLISP